MGCIHDTANIPRIRLRVGEGRSHPERESTSPTPRCSYFLKRLDCLKIQDFLKIQEMRQLGVFCSLNPFFGQPVLWRAQPVLLWVEGRFLTRDASSAGRSADPLLRVLLPGNLYWWRGASFDSSWSGGTSDSALP